MTIPALVGIAPRYFRQRTAVATMEFGITLARLAYNVDLPKTRKAHLGYQTVPYEKDAFSTIFAIRLAERQRNSAMMKRSS